jgi:glycosyltransferase involved in cell wall biosynthesis
VDNIELTILMPCLNEAETIEACVKNALKFIARADICGEVLIADNGSTDGSQAIARKLGARVIDAPIRGYGAALLCGIAAARGRYIIMGDADDSYDFSNLTDFIVALRDGAELVIGNRFRGGIASGAMPFLHRRLGNPVLSFVGRLFFRVPVGDFHCGLRGFRADAIRSLHLQTLGMEFASEMVVRGALAGLRIVEVPTTLRPDGRSRAPHLKTWRDGWRHLKFLLMYSPRWLFIFPGIVFASLGLLLAGALFIGPFGFTRDIALDLNTFVAACFSIVVGIQLVTFGGLSRYYATITGFLPQNRRASILVRYATTDYLVCIAGALILLGAGVFGYAFICWAETHFGQITQPLIPRLVISGLTLFVIGVQMFFSAFLLGVLAIPVTQHVDRIDLYDRD